MKCLKCGQETEYFGWRLRPEFTLSANPIRIPDEERLELHWAHPPRPSCALYWHVNADIPPEMIGHQTVVIPCDCPVVQ